MFASSVVHVHLGDEELDEARELSEALPSPMRLQEVTWRRAEHDPDGLALVWEDGEVTNRELHRMVLSSHVFLRQCGVRKGTRVVSFLDNTPGFVALLIACFRVGAVLAPLSSALTEHEAESYLRVINPGLVIYESPRLRECAVELGCPASSIDEMVLHEAENQIAPCAEMHLNDPCLLVFTSGSTGAPKGVALPMRSILHANIALSDGMRCSGTDIFLNALPVCHLFSINAGILLPLLSNAATVVMSKFSPGGVLDAVERCKVSIFSGVPTMFRRMAKEQRRHPRRLDSLRTGFIAGAKCDGLREYREVLHCVPLVLYGLTESPIIAAADAVQSCESSNVGSLAKGVSIRFLSESGEVRQDGVGELLCKSPGTMLGYFENEVKTKEAIDINGWLHTGDLGFIDDKGCLHIAGRKDDVINRGGCKVLPCEVEEVCASYPGVADCCVLGVPHEELGQQIVAFVEVGMDCKITTGTLRAFAHRRLSKQKLPDQLIVVDRMPYLENEKIDKSALRDIYRMSDGTFSSDDERLSLAH